MLQHSSRLTSKNQSACKTALLQQTGCVSVPGNGDTLFSHVRQLQHSFTRTALWPQHKNQASSATAATSAHWRSIHQSSCLPPLSGDMARAEESTTGSSTRSCTARRLVGAAVTARAAATLEVETTGRDEAPPPGAQPADLSPSEGGAGVKPPRKRATKAKVALSSGESVVTGGADIAEGTPMALPVTSPRLAKDRHSVHDIAEDYIPRSLPDPESLLPLPVPNLGYCCLNVTLRVQKPEVFCNRTCIERTFLNKGLDYVAQMALQNCRDLEPILWWNYDHGIRFFRLTSNFFPWGSKYKLSDLPTYPEIRVALARAGEVARATGQRLTAHPSEFVKLAALRPELLEESLADLEQQGLVFDLMGFEPSYWNKVNIHIGGTYGDKAAAMQRFADSWRRLSPGMKARLTVENDDRASMFSVSDLLWLHGEIGIPIVFDFHHYRFCPGTLSQSESLRAAAATWPAGVRPVVHWSESPPLELGKRPHAHSDFVGQHGPMVLHGLDRDIDVMIEAKAKELALLQYRDVAVNGPILPQTGWDGVEYAGRSRSSVLEGIEMMVSGDPRLQGRSHRKSVILEGDATHSISSTATPTASHISAEEKATAAIAAAAVKSRKKSSAAITKALKEGAKAESDVKRAKRARQTA